MSADVAEPTTDARRAATMALFAKLTGRLNVSVEVVPGDVDQFVFTVRQPGRNSQKHYMFSWCSWGIRVSEIPAGCEIMTEIAAAKRRDEQARGIER